MIVSYSCEMNEFVQAIAGDSSSDSSSSDDETTDLLLLHTFCFHLRKSFIRNACVSMNLASTNAKDCFGKL